MNKLKWLESLRKFWIDKDIDNIIELFDEKVDYWESPFENITNIKSVWNDINEQQIIDLKYRILGEKQNIIIANFLLQIPGNIIDMIYEIQLNDDNKCIYFKQWYMQKN